MSYDIVICIGPNDYTLLPNLIQNVKDNILNYNVIYIITPKENIHTYTSVISSVKFIDESIFPFSKKNIDDLFKTSTRSGWYLQQLLKIYAPIIITELRDNFLIIDADLYFHTPIEFFENNKILFNVGSEYRKQYFDHMNILHPSLKKINSNSGICHLMPMKRKIIQSLIKMIEEYHNNFFWKVFLNAVVSTEYDKAGASEYEMLYTYTLLYFNNDCIIRPLKWRNVDHIDHTYDGVYEAYHWYSRK